MSARVAAARAGVSRRLLAARARWQPLEIAVLARWRWRRIFLLPEQASDPDRDRHPRPVRALARSDPRLCRHRLARPRRVLRLRRLRGGPARQARHRHEPLLALLASGARRGMLLGFVTSFLVLRGSDLTRLMVTLGVALVLRELANRYAWLTGGADGLQGVAMEPLLGLFALRHVRPHRLRLQPGRAVRAVPARAPHRAFAVRPVAALDQGQSAARVRDRHPRQRAGWSRSTRSPPAMPASPARCWRRRRQFASLDVFAFDRSADVLLVLVIGGTGYLYGGLIGAIVFKLLQDYLAALTPQYWQFWIGLLLVVIVLVGRERDHAPGRCRSRTLAGRLTGASRRAATPAAAARAARRSDRCRRCETHRPGQALRRPRRDQRRLAARSRRARATR